jgi:hypothetical protein
VGSAKDIPLANIKDEDRTLGLLLEIVRQTAQGLLERRGVVEPYGVKLLGEQPRPVTFVPAESHPGFEQADLFRAILEELRAPVQEPLHGVALVVAVDTEAGKRVFAAQIESASYRVLALFRYRQAERGFVIAEPELTSELMVSAGLDWPKGV